MADSDRDNDSASEEEEDWMATNWDTIQESSSKAPQSSKETGMAPKADQSIEGSAPLMTRMQLNDYKAGMQGLDKDHINQIIYEVSKGSRFFENERRKEEQVHQRIQEQERHRRTISETELQKGTVEADRLIAQLNLSRDLTQTIVHVDMDAFYAAVEMRENPSLRNKPMAVGSIGMLSTSNYEARKYGVRAAMPGFIGKKLCPQLVIVPVNFPKYREVSEQVRQIFADYDANFCPMSLDEAYLNFTEHITKRQTMAAIDRSFLKRCQTPADSSLCYCDLNITIRDSVLKEEKLETPCNVTTDCTQKKRDINGNTTKKNPEASTSKNDASFVQTVAALHGEADRYASSQKVNESPQVSHTEHHDSRPMVAKGQCPSCGKAVPPYERVTFDVDVESAVHEMRCRIEQRTCLTASAGVAPNMMLSKVCSDQNKPNGQFFLPASCEDIMQFVQKLPIRKISGIGRVTEQLLGALGITTCRDLFEKRDLLYHLYSSVSFSYFMRVACGIGSTQVARASEEERKSMSTEQTFGELSQPEELYNKCLELCQSLAEDLVKEQLMGKTISLKLKTTDFQVRTRAQTVGNYTSDAEVIFTVAKGILRNEILAESPKSLRLRLMGVRMSKLLTESECLQEKQNTIVGFFRKASAPGCQTNPTDILKQSTATSSSEKKHNSHATESGESSSLNMPCMKMLQENGPIEARLSENTQTCVSVAEGTATFTLGGKALVSDAGAASVPQAVYVDVEDGDSTGTYFLGDNQQEINIVAKVQTALNNDHESENEKGSEESENAAGSYRTSKIRGDDCSPVPPTQTQIPSGSVVLNSESETPTTEVLVDTPSKSHRLDGVMYSGPSSSRCSSRCYDWDGEASSSNTDGVRHEVLVHSSFTVREPFTCPVCGKPVGCINLTDFNAHIDECLQPESQPSSATSQNSANKTSAADKVSFSQTATLQRSQTCQSNVNRCSSALKSSTYAKKQRHVSGSCSKSGSTSSTRTEHATAIPCKMDETSPRLGSFEMENAVSVSYPSQQENCSQSEPTSTDYLVCPLCGAERADWTLDSFNQHVDACLNRDTISQILREQRNSEQPSRKRPASSQQVQHRTSQQGKKAKKNQSPKSERSILSFFKT